MMNVSSVTPSKVPKLLRASDYVVISDIEETEVGESRLCCTRPCISIKGVIGQIYKGAVTHRHPWIGMHINSSRVFKISHREISICLFNNGMIYQVILL